MKIVIKNYLTSFKVYLLNLRKSTCKLNFSENEDEFQEIDAFTDREIEIIAYMIDKYKDNNKRKYAFERNHHLALTMYETIKTLKKHEIEYFLVKNNLDIEELERSEEYIVSEKTLGHYLSNLDATIADEIKKDILGHLTESEKIERLTSPFKSNVFKHYITIISSELKIAQQKELLIKRIKKESKKVLIERLEKMIPVQFKHSSIEI